MIKFFLNCIALTMLCFYICICIFAPTITLSLSLYLLLSHILGLNNNLSHACTRKTNTNTHSSSMKFCRKFKPSKDLHICAQGAIISRRPTWLCMSVYHSHLSSPNSAAKPTIYIVLLHV